MKRNPRSCIILFYLIFQLLPVQGQVRIIEVSEIARWYLDADLVVISSLIEKESIHTRSTDRESSGGYSIKCNYWRDQYLVIIDSILKGTLKLDTIAIITPEYFDCYKYKITENTGFDVSATGDTTFYSTSEMMPDTSELGYYFRLGAESKNIIFLKCVQNTYEIFYVMRGVNERDLKFIKKVELKGESIFDTFISY